MYEQRMIRGVAIAALCCLTSLGCAFGEIRWDDPFQREYSLELAQDDYTQLVRWSEFKKASLFVHKDLKKNFLRGAPNFKNFRFSDYQSGPIEYDDDEATVVVEVTYTAYSMLHALEVEIYETQTWEREDTGNNWKVRPVFEGMEKVVLRSPGE